jgi:hypothetical protein
LFRWTLYVVSLTAVQDEKDCQRLPREQRDFIESIDGLGGFLAQSHISAENLHRLEILTQHPINEVKELRTLNSESMALRIRSEPVYDARFPDIVRRHLHPYSISHGQTNKPLSHFPRDMCKNKVLIGKLHPKHCSREDSGNSSFNDDCVLSRHGI